MASSSAVRLYDNTGTLISLPGPPTPPTVKVVPPGVEQDSRDRYRDYPSKNLKPSTLAQIMEEQDGGNTYRWIQLCEEMVEKDPKIGSVRSTRISAILGLDYEVAPPKMPDDALESEKTLADEIAKFFYEMLDSCNFRDLVGDLMDARFKPFAVDWIDWGENRDGKVIAKRFRQIPTTHLKWAYNSDQVYIYNPNEYGSYSRGGEVGVPVPEFQTIRALDKSNRDHPTRAGLLRSLAWPYLFKNIVLKDMVSYGDRFGMPLRILKLDQADFDNVEHYSQYRDAMRTLGSDGSGVISKNTELQIEKAAGEDGINVFQAQLNYFDKVIAWVVLGHELTSQSSPGQGQLGISAAKEVRQDIIEGDCHWIADIVKRDVFTPLVGWNWGWENVHLTPNLQHNYEPPRDLQRDATVMETVARIFGPNLTFSRQQIRDDYGIQAPIGEEAGDEDDDVLRPGAGGQDQSASMGPDEPMPDDEDGEDDADPATVNGARAHVEILSALSAGKDVAVKQEPVDALADRGIKQGEWTSESWASQVRSVLKRAAEDGLTFSQARQKVVALYPALDVKDLDTTLKQMLLLVRLHGRNA